MLSLPQSGGLRPWLDGASCVEVLPPRLLAHVNDSQPPAVCGETRTRSRPRVVLVTRRLEIVSHPLVVAGRLPGGHRSIAWVDICIKAQMACPDVGLHPAE